MALGRQTGRERVAYSIQTCRRRRAACISTVIPLEPIALWHEFSPVVGANRHGRGAVATRSHGPSRPEGDPPQDLVAVEHGGDAALDDHGDRLARVRPADGVLEATELDVAAPVEAAGADLPPRAGGEVDAAVAQEREV